MSDVILTPEEQIEILTEKVSELEVICAYIIDYFSKDDSTI